MAKTVRLKWNIQNIAFLYPPDVFTGTFDNEKMAERHREEAKRKLLALKMSIAGEDDPLLAMRILHKKDQLQFLINNLSSFQEAMRFEEALVTLYIRANTPFTSDGDVDLWHRLFAVCDRARLASLGPPVPFATGTVYQGGIPGFARSLIWTDDRATAVRIASKWQDPGGGEMVEVEVSRDDIRVYLKQRRGNEVIVSPDFAATAAIRPFTP